MYGLTPADFSEWREAARGLLHEGVPPEFVSWQNSPQAGLFVEEAPRPHYGNPGEYEDSAEVNDQSGGQSPGLNGFRSSDTKKIAVPAAFITLAQQAACFVDVNQPRNKWAILYSLLWRITRVNKQTLALKTDPEVQALYAMCKAVNRDMHKMKAFVRFQSSLSDSETISLRDELTQTDRSARFKAGSENTNQREDEYFTAWFEPAHAIVEAIAPFFVKRFTGMSWSILTPHGCAHWNQRQLKISAGTHKPHIPEDKFDVFWRAYYRSIFNPARLKEKAMMSEMPKKYWQYLPEASCIKDLTRNAGSNMGEMIESELTPSERVRRQSSKIKNAQNRLRAENQR